MNLAILSLLALFLCFNVSYSKPDFKAIFQFGDSLSDTGNYLLVGAKDLPGIANLPYGETHFDYPTGRCCDGRLIVDFIAHAFGLPLLPPNLTPGRNFSHGANFAMVAATASDVSFFASKGMGSNVFWTNVSLNVQVDRFEKLLPSLCRSRRECKKYLSRALFMVGEFGGNDYSYPLIAGNKSYAEVTTYVPHVVQTISDAVERLIESGAVHLVVPGHPASGCFALILTVLASSNPDDYEPDTGCLKPLNDVGKYHNVLLHEAVKKLQHKYPHVQIVWADLYTPINQFVLHPHKYGFTYPVLKACCGTGGKYNFDTNERCGTGSSSACADPSKAMDWDGIIHLTETAYHKIATTWLYGPYAHPPIMELSTDNEEVLHSEGSAAEL